MYFIQIFLMKFYWLHVIILAAITTLAFIKKIGIIDSRIFPKIMKPAFFIFWAFIIISLILLFPFMKKNEEEKKQEIMSKNFEEMVRHALKFFFDIFSVNGDIHPLIRFIFLGFFLLLIFESFLLMKIIAFMWGLIIFLTLISLIGKTLPEERAIKKLIGLLKELNSVIVIILLLYGIFYAPFLQVARQVDNNVFSDLAAYHGDNYRQILEKRIKELDNRDAQPVGDENLLNTLKIYNFRFKQNALHASLYPGKELLEGRTVNTILFFNVFENIDVEKIEDERELSEAFEYLLEYLILVNEKKDADGNKYITIINQNSNDLNLPLSISFFEAFIKDLREAKFSKTIFERRIKPKLIYLNAKLAENKIDVDLLRLFHNKEVP